MTDQADEITAVERTGPFRRRGYLYVFPFAILAALVGWQLGSFREATNAVDDILLPAMAAWLSLLFVAFWRLKTRLRPLEAVLFVSFCVFFLLRLSYALYAPPPQATVAEQLTEFAFWFPALYLYAVLAFGVERGKWLSTGFFAACAIAGSPYLVSAARQTHDLQGLYAAAQMYLSGGVTIFLLIVLAETIKSISNTAANMRRLANTDLLTQLSNRRGATQYLEDSIARAQRYQRLFSLLILDIDHFKRVNDESGHDVGDQLLRDFAYLLKMECRQVDHVARWGGEEFVIVLAEKTLTEAEIIANRLKASIEGREFAAAGPVTASFGIAEVTPGDSVRSIIERADAGLLAAKAAGRNQIASATPVPPRQPTKGG